MLQKSISLAHCFLALRRICDRIFFIHSIRLRDISWWEQMSFSLNGKVIRTIKLIHIFLQIKINIGINSGYSIEPKRKTSFGLKCCRIWLFISIYIEEFHHHAICEWHSLRKIHCARGLMPKGQMGRMADANPSFSTPPLPPFPHAYFSTSPNGTFSHI